MDLESALFFLANSGKGVSPMKKWIVAGISFVTTLNLQAQAPEMFRYQGRLVDGTNLVNATLPMSFKLYDAQNGGSLVYEDSGSVLVVDGLYSTTIGDDPAHGSLTNALTNAAVYLELTINGATLSPRERLVSVPYALNPRSSATGITQEALDTRYALLTGSNITDLEAFRISIGALGIGDAIATVTNSVEQMVSTNTTSVPSSAAVKAELDTLGGANAVFSITHPDSRITYYDTIQGVEKGVSDGCTITQLRSFETSTGCVFVVNNATFNFNRLWIKFNTSTNSADLSNPTYGRYETAFRIVGSSNTMNGLRVFQQTQTNYPSTANLYTMDWGGSSYLKLNDCYIGFLAKHTVGTGNPKSIVDVASDYVTFSGGGVFALCSQTNNIQSSVLFVNHGQSNPERTVFVDGTKFVQNSLAAKNNEAFMGGAEGSIKETMFQGCYFTRSTALETGVQNILRNFSGLTLEEAQSILPIECLGYLTSNDVWATQGEFESTATINKLITKIPLPVAVASSNEAVYLREPHIIDTNKVGVLNAYSTLIEYYTHGYPNKAGGGYTIPAYAKTMVNDNYYTASRTMSLLIAPDIDFPTTIKEQNFCPGSTDYSAHTHIYYSSGGTILSKTDKYGTAYAPTNNNGKYSVTLSSSVPTGAVDGDKIVAGGYTFYIDGIHSTNTASFNIYRVAAASSSDPTNGTPATLVSSGITNNLIFIQDNIPGTWNHAFFNSSRGIHLMLRGDNAGENSIIEVLGAQK